MSKKRRHQPGQQKIQQTYTPVVYAKADRSSKYISTQLVNQAVNIAAKNIRDYKNAVALALDNDNPDRSFLADLYNNLMLDNHLASVIDTRILFTQHSPFKVVDDKGDENEKLTWLLERSWFEEIMRYVLFSKFQGTTLIELFELNAEGELSTVNEIPQSHFIPSKGIIIKQLGDLNGWRYKEGVYANYYVQIGKDRDLGILERVATMILAKKLGVGAWMDYIDKYGTPPLFITTDREDNARLQQLFSAALNFKRNSFMVGRGQEKFEVGDTHAGNSKDTFDVFIARINDEISKRVLGGSGMIDEKAYVGSAEIQFKLAEARFNADRLFFKYIFNSQIKPRLVNLSPVYKAFENHYFDWDNSEAKTADGVATLIKKLSDAGYAIDPDFVEQETGMKIIGYKTGANLPSLPPKNEKKK